MKTKKRSAQQQALFDTAEYGWKSVQQVARHELMVVAQKDVTILSNREDGGFWWVGYVDPDTGAKTEQLYHAQDSIYVRVN